MKCLSSLTRLGKFSPFYDCSFSTLIFFVRALSGGARSFAFFFTMYDTYLDVEDALRFAYSWRCSLSITVDVMVGFNSPSVGVVLLLL